MEPHDPYNSQLGQTPGNGYPPQPHAQVQQPLPVPERVAVQASLPAAEPGVSTDRGETLRPVPVVRVLSPVGVEYVFLTFTLFVGAIGLTSALIALVNGKTDFSVLAFPAATLLVCVPIFAFFFLRLKKLELTKPELRLDPSKRRSTQFIQIFSFVACLFTLIGLIFAIFSKIGGQSSVSIGKAILDALCVLVVAGGILFYYWRDEHKTW